MEERGSRQKPSDCPIYENRTGLVIHRCKANSSNKPPTRVMNSVTANRVGTSMTTWETIAVGIASPPHPFPFPLAGEYEH